MAVEIRRKTRDVTEYGTKTFLKILFEKECIELGSCCRGM